MRQQQKLNEAIMKERVAKDRVAFLLNRAPATSKPAEGLLELSARSPLNATGVSTSKVFHHISNHQAGDQLGGSSSGVPSFTRKKDRMTEYFESKLLLGNIGFRK